MHLSYIQRYSKIYTIPNLICYLRVALILLFISYANTQVVIASLFYITSVMLDALDGHIARKYSQETELGKFLDFVIDRVGTLVLMLYLAIAYSKYQFFIYITLIDFVAHFATLYLRFQLNSKTHKSIFKSSILRKYYGNGQRYMVITIIGYEGTLITLFLYDHLNSLLSTFLLIIFIPLFIQKVLVHLFKLKEVVVRLCEN